MQDKKIKILAKNADRHLIYGVVYEPDKVDTQNDFAKPDVIETAAHNFMISAQTVGIMHKKKTDGVRIVESFVAPHKMDYHGQNVEKGTCLVAMKVLSQGIWDKVKTGEFKGISMGGQYRKTQVEGVA